MLKLLIFTFSLALLNSSKEACNHKKELGSNTAHCFKARLEVKGGCMNYTIGVLSKGVDTALLVPTWTDENTGKEYKNVFALKSRCNFPNTINEGDEFYFEIDSTSVQNCNVCLMYYPTPSKKLSIKVLPGPCQP